MRDIITETLGADAVPVRFTSIGGGCINNGGKLITTAGDLFLKWNSDALFPGMFDAEAKGLALLRSPGAIRIPAAASAGRNAGFQFILMEFIGTAPRVSRYWEILGQRLASLHRNTQHFYGLDHDNYIGSLRQHNTPSSSWLEFFISQRLEAQLKPAVDAGRIGTSLAKKFQRLYDHLPELLPTEPPSLLHGDLWNGNLITDDKGEPCLIDPAVYYGHREMDLAMTQLFGGFGERFYASYQEAFPTSPGLQQRLDIFNLYPLLVHVNLFGSGYVNGIESTLNRYA